MGKKKKNRKLFKLIKINFFFFCDDNHQSVDLHTFKARKEGAGQEGAGQEGAGQEGCRKGEV